MRIRIKLLLGFVGYSILIMLVGLVFYLQLKNLVEPLSPQSLPKSVDHLEKVIDEKDIIFKMLYQQLLTENNFESYVYTKNINNLQDYYMYQFMYLETLDTVRDFNITTWTKLITQYKILREVRQSILDNIKFGNIKTAENLLDSNAYQNSYRNIQLLLNDYYQQFDTVSNEKAVSTVKTATKHATEVLDKSLHTTLLIFLDAILISILLVYVASQTVVNPLKSLHSYILKVFEGDLNVQMSPELKETKAEIGDLARAFDTLIIKLRQTTVSRDDLQAEVARRKHYEENLRQTAKVLQQSNKELDEFAHAASHDLRAPLQAIENLAGWIESDAGDKLPENSRKHLTLLKRRIKRLDNLIAGILTYSRVGKVGARLEEVNLNELMAEIIDSLSPPSHIKVMVDHQLPIVTGDRIELTQVFSNLISNAIKYNDKQSGQVNIGYIEKPTNYIFYVRDNGPGIDLNYKDKIFQIFQTLQSRDTIESSGIGLAIVKKIIEKENCKIWIESTLGSGTTFYFTWPIHVTLQKKQTEELL